MYLIVIDAHSKWPEVVEMTTTTSHKTITELQRLFSMYGIPTQLVSDNGPQFTSEEFTSFMKRNGIKHIRSAPYHPSTNGTAERFVQTFKKAMKASRKSSLTQTTVSTISYLLIAQRHTLLQMNHLVSCLWVVCFAPVGVCYNQT